MAMVVLLIVSLLFVAFRPIQDPRIFGVVVHDAAHLKRAIGCATNKSAVNCTALVSQLEQCLAGAGAGAQLRIGLRRHSPDSDSA